MADESRSNLQFSVDLSTFLLLQTLASDRGIAIKRLCEEAVSKWAEDEAVRRKGSSPELELYRLHQLTMRKQSQREQVKEVVIHHMNHPSEENLERAQEACEAGEVTMEDIVAEIKGDSDRQAKINSKKSVLEEAIEWLSQRMAPGKEYAVRDIYDDGKTMGFKEYVVERAKTKLGGVSDKKGTRWYWSIPIESEDEDIQH